MSTKILITGVNSFVGNALKIYLSSWPEQYITQNISLRNSSWRSEKFRGFDVIFHVAGLAHDSTRNADKDLYYAVNSQLAFDTARKAMYEGVKQFIFMSSSIVYGKSGAIGHEKIITRDTPVNPESFYGASKVKAEEMLNSLDCENFRVCILRCPMIYGKGCKGNYRLLSKLARVLPVFPRVKNTRSMLYVENLAEFIRLMIDNHEHGTFWPQNAEYSNTSGLVETIAEIHGRKIVLVPGFEGSLKILSHFSGLVNKAFGSLAYDKNMSDYKFDYRLYDLRQSIERTET